MKIFTRLCHFSLPSPDESDPHADAVLVNNNFNILLPSTSRFAKLYLHIKYYGLLLGKEYQITKFLFV
jgi:hypothetical protein